MKTIPSWVVYSILRLVVFLIPFGVLMVTGVPWWLSTIVAAVMGLCISYIFLRIPRERMAADIYQKRARAAHRSVDPAEDVPE